MSEYTWPKGKSAAVMISIDVDADTPLLWRARGETEIRFIAELERFQLYDSSLAGLDWPYTCSGITEVPISWAREDTARFKLTGLADRWPPTGPDQVLAEWIFDYEATVERGGLFVLTLHDWIAGRPAQLRVLDALLERIRADGATWVTTGQEIADHHRRDLNLRG